MIKGPLEEEHIYRYRTMFDKPKLIWSGGEVERFEKAKFRIVPQLWYGAGANWLLINHLVT